MMQGIAAFSTLEEAVRHGFTLYDRSESAYIVRAKTPNGWALAIVPLARRPFSPRT